MQEFVDDFSYIDKNIDKRYRNIVIFRKSETSFSSAEAKYR